MKPFSTGSEMKLARNPRRSRPATSASDPDRERERDRERDELVRVAGVGEVGDRRGRERRGRRHRPGDEVARAAERRVEDQRARRRVQADDRRDAGDRRVGERLGHEHRPDRQAGDHVAAKEPPFVGRHPRWKTGGLTRGDSHVSHPHAAERLEA